MTKDGLTTSMDLEQQVALLMQGTEYGDDELRRSMEAELRTRLVKAEAEGRKLRVYCGFDPRTSDLHLGHMVPIRKLHQFQQLGHEVIFLVGRYTSLIGDPSDKDKLRPQITLDEATANAETYAEQAFHLLDPDQTRIEYNDTWLAELTFADLIEAASHFTIQQFLTRETFRKRFDNADPIFLHEFFYALMQAYDAYHLKTDVQVGGTDQLFNIVTAARKLMEAKGELPNIPIILGILPGTDGEVKMSKSLGNHIPLRASAADMYGKVMSVPDKAMPAYFRLATRWEPEEIREIEAGLDSGQDHPRDIKMRLAREIVSIYHGEEAAGKAEGRFKRVFQRGDTPEEMEAFELRAGLSLVDLMVETGMAPSKSQARRLIDQNGVRLDGETLHDPDLELDLRDPAVLQVGKRRFRRLLPSAPSS
ncbi:MAG: tyrosine--tRNA ligase [Anaerolineales bacterium]